MTPGGAGRPPPPGPGGLRIRPAERRDLPAVLELWRADGVVPTATDDLAGLQGLLDRDPQALLVAEVAGSVAGTVVAGFDGWRANLYRLAVAPGHRRRGVGRALVLEAVARLRERGARRVSAFVVREDARAVAFWSSLEADGLRRDTGKVRWVLSLDGPPSSDF